MATELTNFLGVQVKDLTSDPSFDSARLGLSADPTTGKLYKTTIQQWIDLLTGLGVAYAGPADTDTDPGTPAVSVFYTATTTGTYTNFKDGSDTALVLAEGEVLAILSFNGTSWVKQTISIGSAYVSKSAISYITGGKNLFDKAVTVSGYYINSSTGAKTAQAGYSITDKIPVKAGTKYSFSGYGTIHYAIGVGFYKSDDTLISGTVAVPQNISSGSAAITTPADTDYILATVITAASGDNTDINVIQIEEGSTSTVYEPYLSVISGIDSKLITAGKVKTDSSDEFSPVNIGFYNENTLKKNSLTLAPIGKNKFNKNDVQLNAYIDPSTGVLTTIVTDYRCSEYIAINPGAYTISGLASLHYSLGVAFYDDSKTLIGHVYSAQDVTSFTITAPSGSTYLRFTYKTTKTGDNTSADNVQIEEGSTATDYEAVTFGVYAIEDNKIFSYIQPKTAGLNMILFGDSITTVKSNEGVDQTNWPTYALPILGMTANNYALSGASFTDWAYEDGDRQQLSVQINDAISDSVTGAVVFIAIGTNDYQRKDSFGDYATAMGKAALTDLDRTLVIEAARWAFWTIKTQWPNAICFYASPLQRAATPNGSESDDNGGTWLREPIERMARRYGFTVIDQYSESGIVKDFEIDGSPGRYLRDGLHPSTTSGQQLQGRFLANKILEGFYR